MDFGILLRAMRKQNGLTLKALSERSGVSTSQIGKIEQGLHYPPRETVIKLARGFSFNENEFLEMAGFKVSDKKIETELDNDTKYRTYLKYNLTCQICGRKAPSTEISLDFIKPLNLGGTTDMKNVIVLCLDCKDARRNSILSEGIENDYLYNKKNETHG